MMNDFIKFQSIMLGIIDVALITFFMVNLLLGFELKNMLIWFMLANLILGIVQFLSAFVLLAFKQFQTHIFYGYFIVSFIIIILFLFQGLIIKNPYDEIFGIAIMILSYIVAHYYNYMLNKIQQTKA